MRIVIEHGKFLDATHCDKCNVKLYDEHTNPNGPLRVKSFFTWGALCTECKKKEKALICSLQNRGINPKKFENSGGWPDLNKVMAELEKKEKKELEDA